MSVRHLALRRLGYRSHHFFDEKAVSDKHFVTLMGILLILEFFEAGDTAMSKMYDVVVIGGGPMGYVIDYLDRNPINPLLPV